MTTKKTLIALTASLGLGVLSVVALTACGDNPTDINPFDAGSDARPDTGTDAGSDAAKTDGGGTGDGGGTSDGGGKADSGGGSDASSDAPTGG